MAFSRFNISRQIKDIGVYCQVVNKGSQTFNDYGDISGATYTYNNALGVIQQLSVSDLEVQEGKMQPQDIIAFFDLAVSYSGALVIGSFISGSFFGSRRLEYEIKGVEQILGHYEVYASKL